MTVEFDAGDLSGVFLGLDSDLEGVQAASAFSVSGDGYSIVTPNGTDYVNEFTFENGMLSSVVFATLDFNRGPRRKLIFEVIAQEVRNGEVTQGYAFLEASQFRLNPGFFDYEITASARGLPTFSQTPSAIPLPAAGFALLGALLGLASLRRKA